jgi:hypothetical protein
VKTELIGYEYLAFRIPFHFNNLFIAKFYASELTLLLFFWGRNEGRDKFSGGWYEWKRLMILGGGRTSAFIGSANASQTPTVDRQAEYRDKKKDEHIIHSLLSAPPPSVVRKWTSRCVCQRLLWRKKDGREQAQGLCTSGDYKGLRSVRFSSNAEVTVCSFGYEIYFIAKYQSV